MAVELTVVLRFEHMAILADFLQDVEDEFECVIVESSEEEV